MFTSHKNLRRLMPWFQGLVCLSIFNISLATLGAQEIKLPARTEMFKPTFIELNTKLDSIRTLSMNPINNNQIFAASESGEAVMLDINSHAVSWQAKFTSNWQYYLNSIFSIDGQILAVAEIRGVPKLLRSLSGNALITLSAACTLHTGRDSFGAMAFSSDARLLAAAEFNQSGPPPNGDGGRSVNIWDTQSGKCFQSVTVPGSEPIHGISFISNNSILVVKRGMAITFFEVNSGKKINESLFITVEDLDDFDFTPIIHKITVSRDLRYAVAAYGNYSFGGDMRDSRFAIALIDLQAQKRLWLKTIKGGIEDLAFSADGKEIAGFNMEGIWLKLHTTTGELKESFYEPEWFSETENDVGTPPPHAFNQKLDAGITVYSKGILRHWRLGH